MNKEKVVDDLAKTIINRRATLNELIKLDNKIRKLHSELIKIHKKVK